MLNGTTIKDKTIQVKQRENDVFENNESDGDSENSNNEDMDVVQKIGEEEDRSEQEGINGL
jgi:hypothetical protein